MIGAAGRFRFLAGLCCAAFLLPGSTITIMRGAKRSLHQPRRKNRDAYVVPPTTYSPHCINRIPVPGTW